MRLQGENAQVIGFVVGVVHRARARRMLPAALCCLALFSMQASADIFPDWWRQDPPATVDPSAAAVEPATPAADSARPGYIQELGVEDIRKGRGFQDPLDPARVAEIYREPEEGSGSRYGIQPGDVLVITVWKEPDLAREVVVSPDGWITFPLIGELQVEGLTVNEVRGMVREALTTYIPRAVVAVSLQQINGNQIYVLGKVARPGVFPFMARLDVMKALSLAGGATRFAALDKIKILRREDGQQTALEFNYDDVSSGKRLEQNIELRSGDIVLVP